jgi:hypothetical protein
VLHFFERVMLIGWLVYSEGWLSACVPDVESLPGLLVMEDFESEIVKLCSVIVLRGVEG